MRTGYVVNGQIKPGRNEDAISQAQEAIKLFERLGSDEVAYRLGGGGTPIGSSSFKFEAPSQSAMGELLDHMMTDSDYVALTTRIGGEDAPTVLNDLIGFNVLDVGLPTGTPGQVGTLISWQPHAGKADKAIELAVQASKVLLRLGASRCRVVQVNTGPNLPSFVSTTESESFTAQGRWREALATDKEWHEIAARLSSKDAPGRYLRFSEWFSPV
jgi:hypothetical protein